MIRVAAELFGAQPFDAVSTRQIAEAAVVNLPAIKYYFGSKQGLYEAVAGKVVADWIRTTHLSAQQCEVALEMGSAPEVLREKLAALMGDVVTAMLSQDLNPGGASLGMRELLEPTKSFNIFYEALWKPGIDLVARMIAAIRQRNDVSDADIIDAMMMISSISAFQNGREVAQRSLGWGGVGVDERRMVQAALTRSICAL